MASRFTQYATTLAKHNLLCKQANKTNLKVSPLLQSVVNKVTANSAGIANLDKVDTIDGHKVICISSNAG